MIIETIGDDQYRTIELVNEVSETIVGNILGILDESWKYYTYYKSDGTMIRLKALSGHKLGNRNLWSLLANTVYNPQREIKVKQIDLGHYEIKELTNNILKWVERDDDILLQYIDEDDIQMLLSRIEIFDDLIFAIRAINGEFETDTEFKKQLVSLGMTWLIEEE